MPAVLSSKITTTVSHATNGQQSSGSSGDLANQIAAVYAERIAALDKSIQDELTNIQNMNNWLSLAKPALNLLEQKRPSSPTVTVDVRQLTFSNSGNTAKLDAFLKDAGFSGNTATPWNQQQFSDATTWLKTKIDTVTANLQLSLLRLQALMDKKQQSFDQMTAMMNAFKNALNKPNTPFPPR
ncbi:hypothetical protein HL658_09570 [Azospirillum sp. RWY-5-1]|uniref:Uncharacterized protein n=1 Tax=Azospirillum oleiclasticum TaxID=2735135 RepID=A0ABX2T6Y8_9PROT|nr:hypothetical protein [Azospirillum oleiclasticum]NYZ12799.1 hypothetical protein [Azospirillum oleiclasticum]NYZ19959.1 hypothetical protein [Azospirillum oleiclasticum]